MSQAAWTMQSPYTYGRHIKADSLEEAVETVKKSFVESGWGLPEGTTNLDFAKIFSAKKIDDNFRPSKVLGFCHPSTAHEVLLAEPASAVLLPCNVVVAMANPGIYQVATISPRFMGQTMQNKEALSDAITSVDNRILEALNGLPVCEGESW